MAPHISYIILLKKLVMAVGKNPKVFQTPIDAVGGYYVNGVQVIDADGNIDAPITTTNATFSGNTTIGDSSADTNTINATTTANAPITVGVNDTGHDVKFFGATAGKSWLWDESADKMIVTGSSSLSGDTTVTSAGAAALAVGVNGATNPALTIDASTASSATGVKVKSAAAAGGVAVSVTSSGTDEALTVDAKGAGTITIGGTSTGNVTIQRATTVNGQFTANGPAILANGESVAAGGSANARIQIGSTANFGVFVGSGAPSVSAAKGSLYLRTDGSTTNDRAYINSDGSTTWTALTTAA